MILENNKGDLKIVKEADFKLEKDIQTLVENNMDTLLGIKFLQTEFSISTYRFDSVGYDKDSNAFVIVEYKRGKNDSLVDQGLTYLRIVLDRKAELVLLYNKVFASSKQQNDFDWSQTRIVFVSPRFTKYQLSAASFKNLPFEFYEIKKYENGCIEFNEVGLERSQEINLSDTTVSNKEENISNEIKVYTEDDHITKADQNIKELYEDLRSRILDIGDIKIDAKKLYIAFKGTTNICDVELEKKKIKLTINLPYGKLDDRSGLTRKMVNDDGSKIGHWGNGDYQCHITSEEQLDYLMPLIRQSYEVNK